MSGIDDENIITIPAIMNPNKANEAVITIIAPMDFANILKIVPKISEIVLPTFQHRILHYLQFFDDQYFQFYQKFHQFLLLLFAQC